MTIAEAEAGQASYYQKASAFEVLEPQMMACAIRLDLAREALDAKIAAHETVIGREVGSRVL